MLNTTEIMEIIPQRAPFLMIDRVEEYEPGKVAQHTRRYVSMNHIFKDIFQVTQLCQVF